MGTGSLGQDSRRRRPEQPSVDPDWPEPTTLVLGLAGFIVIVCAALATLLATGLP